MSAEVKKLAIKSAIYQMGLRFNQEPSKEKIEAYASDLIEYTPEQITYAFKKVINSGSAFFPSLAEILKHLKPVEEKREDQAPGIVAEIIQLIRLYGKYDEPRMVQAASEDAKLVLEKLGDTSDIRNSENFELMKAQLERLVKSVLSRKESITKAKELQSIGIVIDLPKFEKPRTTYLPRAYLGFDSDNGDSA